MQTAPWELTPTTRAGTPYIRIYVEPGAGYRLGAGDFGAYASAKAMLVLFSGKG